MYHAMTEHRPYKPDPWKALMNKSLLGAGMLIAALFVVLFLFFGAMSMLK